MSDVLSRQAEAWIDAPPPARRIPRGIGLLIGAAASLAMWGGIAVAVLRLVG